MSRCPDCSGDSDLSREDGPSLQLGNGKCGRCGGSGLEPDVNKACEFCRGTGICQTCGGAGDVE
jgi:hypothetical protein